MRESACSIITRDWKMGYFPPVNSAGTLRASVTVNVPKVADQQASSQTQDTRRENQPSSSRSILM